jgi:hypothetical protein
MSDRERIDSVFRQIQDWSAEDRAALAYEILRDLRQQPLAPPPRDTLSRAIGALQTASPPPTDEEVKRWVEEARLAKHGFAT